MRWVILLVGAAGCGGPGEVTPSDGSVDATTAALHIEWETRPEWSSGAPLEVGRDIRIDRITAHVEHLRLVADVETSLLDPITLAWDDDNEPDDDTFSSARPGLYSKLEFELGNSDVVAARPADDDDERFAFEIRGTVRIQNNDVSFHILDTGQLMVEKMIMPPFELRAGGEETFEISIELPPVFARIDFSMLPSDDDGLQLRSDNPMMAGVRDELSRMIKLSMKDD